MVNITFHEVAISHVENKTSNSGNEFLKGSILIQSQKKQNNEWQTVDRYYINVLVFDKKFIELIKKHSSNKNELPVFTIVGNLQSEIYNGIRQYTLFANDVIYIKQITFTSKKTTPGYNSPSNLKTPGVQNNDEYNPYLNNSGDETNPFKN